MALFCLVAPALGCTASVSTSSQVFSLSGATMGTRYSIKCWSNDLQADGSTMQADIDQLLGEINQQMSTYLPDSELSRFNAASADAWFPVSHATAFVTSAAIRFHKLTEGASDVTVGPLVQLWDFGPGRTQPSVKVQPPTAELIAATQSKTGCENLEARLNPPALKKNIDGLQVDLSSIAKGYGVDAVVELLTASGFANFMVEIGGEVRAGGTRLDGKPWRIGVEAPNLTQRVIHRVISLQNRALATSGDYRNFREIDGQKVSHIINPTTGRPLPYRGWSVTLLTPTCLEADALATALLVMGEARGYDWCEQHEVAAMFLIRRGDKIVEKRTPKFAELGPLTKPSAQGM